MLTRGEESQLRALRTRRNREAAGRFLAEGVRVVEDLLASPLEVSFVAAASSLEDNERGRALRAAAEERRVPWRIVPDAEFVRFAETETPQGAIAVGRIPRNALADLRMAEEPAVLLVSDAVQDPGNFGTLVRTAEALGARGVVALPGTVDAWNPKTVRAAVGSSFRVPVVVADWDQLGPWAAAERVPLLAAAGDGAPLEDDPPRRAALIVGNEGAGVSAASRSRADRIVSIPLRGRAESLNVAAAAAILLHHLLR